MLKIYEQHGFSIGNVISLTQNSMFIRCKQNIECNGFVREVGQLQKYDRGQIPNYVDYRVVNRACDYANAKQESVCLYCIRHYRGEKVIIKGYVITDYNYNVLYSLTMGSKGSDEIIDSFLTYIEGWKERREQQNSNKVA